MQRTTPLSSPASMRFTGYDGVQIQAWDYGGEGPVVLLCHCTGGVSRLWDPVVAAMGPGARYIAVDTRGHGGSDKPHDCEAYRWDFSGRDLLAVLDALGQGPGLSAIGHSAGGAHIVHAELLRPGQFSRAILIDPIIGPAGPLAAGGKSLAEGARRRKTRFSSREQARERLLKKPPMLTWSEAAVEAYLAHGLEEDGPEVVLRCPGVIEAWCYEQRSAYDVFDRLGEVQTKVLLVSGDHSPLFPLVEAQNRRLPHAAIRVLPEAGHFAPQERPEAFAAIAREWLFL